MDMLEARPDTSDHQIDAGTYGTGKLAIGDAISPPEYYVPPIHDCTPYQMHAIAARLKTGHSEPHTPKEERETTGNPM